jgi:hypothetical protein
MEERAETDGRAVVATGVQRTRAGLANAAAASRRAFRRVRRGGSPATRGGSGPGEPSPEGAIPAGPTDLADADVSVQRAWKHLRLTIAIIVTVAPVVAALISWRIKVWRARRRGRRLDL